MDAIRLPAFHGNAVVSCQRIGIYKPHPEAYEAALALLGRSPQETLMMVCNDFDLNAAQGAGMKTALVRRPDRRGRLAHATPTAPTTWWRTGSTHGPIS